MRDQHVWLNGASLEAAHPLILLQHIDESAPETEVKTSARAGAPGQFVTARKLTAREISIVFAVRERLDFARRAAAVSAAASWLGSGGWLELSSRPGLRIWAVPTAFPGPGKLRDWTQDIRMTLTAYHWPLWIEKYPNTATLTGKTSETAEISVGGTWDTRLEAEITPNSAALTSATLSVAGQTMTLTGLNVTAGTTLKIWWDERHLLRIEAAGTGLLGKRAGDDLVLPPGRHEVAVTANTASDFKLMARGCFL